MGRPLHVRTDRGQSSPSYSVTVVTDLTQPNGILVSDLRTKSNTALDFLEWVVSLFAVASLARVTIW